MKRIEMMFDFVKAAFREDNLAVLLLLGVFAIIGVVWVLKP